MRITIHYIEKYGMHINITEKYTNDIIQSIQKIHDTDIANSTEMKYKKANSFMANDFNNH